MLKEWAILNLIASIRLRVVACGSVFFKKFDIDKVHGRIAADHDSIEHISANDLVALRTDEIVLFDVREPDEFAVSHLPGAVLLDPDTSASEFAAQFGERLSGKRVVFYCSVGFRSSILASRVAQIVKVSSGNTPANLIGGIFKWRNEGRSLVTKYGSATRNVHPYDDRWGRLINDREALSYLPK